MNGSYRSVLAMLLAPLAAVLGVLAFASAPAQALIVHKYLSTPHITVPESTPIPYAQSPGHVTQVSSMTVDEGHIWAAEHIAGTLSTRTDEFDDASGSFLLQSPAALGGRDSGVAVAHVGGEALVFVGGGGVGVFNGVSGAYLGEWTGVGTPQRSFDEVNDVAIDDSSAPGDWAAGDVYVVNRNDGVLDVFKPQAGGGEDYVTQLQLPGRPYYVAVSATTGEVFVYDETAPKAFVIEAFAPNLILWVSIKSVRSLKRRVCAANRWAASPYLVGLLSTMPKMPCMSRQKAR